MRLTTSRTIAGISTYAEVDTSPATCTRPVVTSVSTATRPFGSAVRIASRIESEIWSQILSGCPSVTDSDVNRRRSVIDTPVLGARLAVRGRMRRGRTPVCPRGPTSSSSGASPASRGLFGATKAQLVLVDLVHRDGQRLVLDGRVDERADVVEEVALVQVGVVVVDLARALGREDHELVLRVDLLEQAVDGGLDDALVRSGHGNLLVSGMSVGARKPRAG